ncbi:MAG: flavin reductase [Clostridia bacterium]|nr:flavin reductase [Clostridia bacterium]
MREITPNEINGNTFKLIGSDWMLITAAKNDGSVNTMTASWGGVGVLWNKNVCFVFIRPQRYTYEFTEDADEFTLSFYPEEMRNALTVCGRKSGRDCDKISEAGLIPAKLDNTVYFEGAKLVMKVKKLYKTQLEKSEFIDSLIPNTVYPTNDYHYVYICEIEKVLEK